MTGLPPAILLPNAGIESRFTPGFVSLKADGKGGRSSPGEDTALVAMGGICKPHSVCLPTRGAASIAGVAEVVDRWKAGGSESPPADYHLFVSDYQETEIQILTLLPELDGLHRCSFACRLCMIMLAWEAASLRLGMPARSICNPLVVTDRKRCVG